MGKKEDKLGQPSSTCELILEDCKPMCWSGGRGYKIAIQAPTRAASAFGAQMLGVAWVGLGTASKYAQERKQFGVSISDFQGIQFQIAQMHRESKPPGWMVYKRSQIGRV